MSDNLKILLTVVAGITVFVTGQVIQKWFIDPIQDQRRTIGEIAHALVFYAYVQRTVFPEDVVQEAHRTLRSLSAQLHRTLVTIPCYRFFAFIRLVPRTDAVMDAALELIKWSNSLTLVETVSAQTKILSSLRMKHLIRPARERDAHAAS